MIPLLPIGLNLLSCSKIKITDNTDYTVDESGLYPFSIFETGLRIIRFTYPDGSIKLYCTHTKINSTQLVPFVLAPYITNPYPLAITIEQLDTDITVGNNGNASWEFDLPSGEYTVDIIVVPSAYGFPFQYHSSQLFVIDVDNGEKILLFNVKLSHVAGYFVYFNLKNDLTGVTLYGTPSPWTGGQDYSLNPLNIVSVDIVVDCELSEAIDCIEAKLNKTFCKNCKCAHICKNKDAMSVVKASLLITELNYYGDDPDTYNEKLALFTPVIKTLCRC